MNVVTGIRDVRHAWLWIVAIALSAILPYWRSFSLPPMEDDYIQIWLGRVYGAPSQWPALLLDPLYRCRATSILLTRATEEIFGNIEFIFNLQSLLIHVFNALLVAALGRWRFLGYGISLPAAFFWGLSERHHEAVIWYAALPEQLVFTFSLLTFIAWIEYWQTESRRAYWLAFVFFLLALFSKESGVVFCGLALLPLLLEWRRWKQTAFDLSPFYLLALAYFSLNYFAKSDHLHWNDGTFRLGWHFIPVMVNSSARIFWVWGSLALVLLFLFRRQANWWVVALGLAWIVICLAPYSFISYMPRVPSRHVYLAMVGRSLILALALTLLWQHRRVVAFTLAAFACSNTIYVAIFKQGQFVARAQVTEALIEKATQTPAKAYVVECFPLAPEVAAFALHQRLGVDPKRVAASRSGACSSLTVRPLEE